MISKFSYLGQSELCLRSIVFQHLPFHFSEWKLPDINDDRFSPLNQHPHLASQHLRLFIVSVV